MMIDRLRGIIPVPNTNNSQETQNKGSIGDTSDTIQVSLEAKEMAELYMVSELVAASPDVRAERIAEVKEKIKDPSYINETVVNSTADRILDAFGL